MTRRQQVRYLVVVKTLMVFFHISSLMQERKAVSGFGKKKKIVSVLVCENQETHRWVTEQQDMTLAVKIAFHSNTNKQENFRQKQLDLVPTL